MPSTETESFVYTAADFRAESTSMKRLYNGQPLMDLDEMEAGRQDFLNRYPQIRRPNHRLDPSGRPVDPVE